MNFTNILIRKTKPVVEKIIKLPSLVTAIYVGSVGADKADEHSDVDIAAYFINLPKAEARRRLWKIVVPKAEVNIHPDVSLDYIIFDKIGINIGYHKIKDLIDRVNRFVDGKVQWEEGEIDRELIRSRIIYDPKNIIKDLERRVSRYPIWLKKRHFNLVSSTRGQFFKIEKALGREDWIHINEIVNNIVRDVVNVVYALNNTYFSRSYYSRWVSLDIKEFGILPKDFIDNLDIIIHLNNIEQLVEKLTMINKIVDQLELLCRKQIKDFKTEVSKAEAKQSIKRIKSFFHS